MSPIRNCAECKRLEAEAGRLEAAVITAGDPGEVTAALAVREELPAGWWDCEKCSAHLERYRGEWYGHGDVVCRCGASYNAFGQRLRDEWAENPAWKYDDVDDLEGYEQTCLAREARTEGI